MTEAEDLAFSSGLLEQLKARNAIDATYTNVFIDYQALLRTNRELQVRNAQLDKEARELRLENETLCENAQYGRAAAASTEEVTELKKSGQKLQDELNGLYKEKAKIAQDYVAATKQLQIVRENFEKHDRALDERSNTIKELKTAKKDLLSQLQHLREAHAEAVKELEARQADKEGAQQRLQAAELDNAELSKRLVEMKMTEIDRMNDVNNICNEMMRNARSMERAAAAESSSRQVLGKFFNANKSNGLKQGMATSGLLVDQLKSVAARNSLIGSKLPSGEARTVQSHSGGCYALAFDRSGARMASAGSDKVIRLWEPGSAVQTGCLRGMMDSVTDLAFVSDQDHIIAAGSDKSLRLWEIGSARERHTLTGHSDKVTSVSCDPINRGAAVSSSEDRTIKTWNLAKGHVAETVMYTSKCHSVRWSIHGQALISGHRNGNLCFWDIKNLRKPVHEIAGLHAQEIVSVAIGLQTGSILTCGKDHLLQIVDLQTYRVRQSMRSPGFTVGNTWCSATISSDERHACAGSTDGTVYIWETETGAVAKTVKEVGGKGVLASCWSPQGTPIVTSDRGGAISFWHG